jgi:uncharacterized protein YjlB
MYFECEFNKFIRHDHDHAGAVAKHETMSIGGIDGPAIPVQSFNQLICRAQVYTLWL